MNMTKRDVADLALVGIGIVFLLTLLQSLTSLAYYCFDQGAQRSLLADKATSIALSLLHSTAMFVICYLLIIKRHVVLNRIFPDSEDHAVMIPDGLAAITEYSFWIRIIGIYMLLKSVADFTGLLVVVLSSQHEFNMLSFNGRSTVQLFIVSLLSVIIVLKADYIGSIIKKKIVQHAPPAGRGEAPRP